MSRPKTLNSKLVSPCLLAFYEVDMLSFATN